MATSLDDLDRLAFLLARVVRTQHATWLTQGFAMGDLESRLIPFPDARRELADGSPAHYERLVLRLLTGERGYLLTDPELRDAARRTLAQADPALGLVRPWAATRVVLARPSAGLGIDRSCPPAEDDPPAALASRTAAPPAPHSAAAGAPCLHCGGALPSQRGISFCPHCGCDLRRRQCPACSTALELEWRFCVTCGRGADHAPPVQRAG